MRCKDSLFLITFAFYTFCLENDGCKLITVKDVRAKIFEGHRLRFGSPGARDRLWRSRLLGKLANFSLARIISWTLVVNAGVAVETLEWAVCGGRV